MWPRCNIETKAEEMSNLPSTWERDCCYRFFEVLLPILFYFYLFTGGALYKMDKTIDSNGSRVLLEVAIELIVAWTLREIGNCC